MGNERPSRGRAVAASGEILARYGPPAAFGSATGLLVWTMIVTSPLAPIAIPAAVIAGAGAAVIAHRNRKN